MCFYKLLPLLHSFSSTDIKRSRQNSIWIPAKVWQALFLNNIQSRKYWCWKNHPNFRRLNVIALVMSSLALPLYQVILTLFGYHPLRQSFGSSVSKWQNQYILWISLRPISYSGKIGPVKLGHLEYWSSFTKPIFWTFY